MRVLFDSLFLLINTILIKIWGETRKSDLEILIKVLDKVFP